MWQDESWASTWSAGGWTGQVWTRQPHDTQEPRALEAHDQDPAQVRDDSCSPPSMRAQCRDKGAEQTD
eukprot:4087425-Pyramimonas_sp.AAC.1